MKISAPIQKFISFCIIAFGILLMHFGGLPMFISPAIILVVIWLFLNFITKEKFSDLLFSFKRFEFKAVWIGAIAAIILAAFFQFLWGPVMDKILPNEKIDLTAFDSIRGNVYNYIFLLLMALLLGGFFEEVFFHGFIFTRFEKLLPGKYSVIISVIVSNIIFGFYHYQMGIIQIFLATIAGLAYHFLILKYNRNLWYGLFFHTFFDFIGLTQIYLEKV